MASISHIQQISDSYIHESFEMVTEDHDDHSFCGIMFDVSVNSKDLPVLSFQIEGISVRGGFGHMSIWMTENSWKGKHNRKTKWKMIYEKFHEPSQRQLQSLVLNDPVVMKDGESIGLYIHSRAQNDDSIVYDNQRGHADSHDDLITVSSGMAHLDFNPFGENAPWGGSAWRLGRSFVGRISYGVRYQLWTPEVSLLFPSQFRLASSAFCHVHAFSWKGLPLDIIKYVLNMCPPSWFDCPAAMNLKNRKIADQSKYFISPFHALANWEDSPGSSSAVKYVRRCCTIA